MSCKQGHSPLPEYNQGIITDTSLPLALRSHSSFAKCPCLCSKMTPFRIMHSIGCHVFLISFRLKQVLRLVLTFMTFTLLKITANCFAECPSIWVGLMFPQDYTLGRKHPRSDSFLAQPVRRPAIAPRPNDAPFDQLIRLVSTRVLRCKLFFFPPCNKEKKKLGQFEHPNINCNI